MGAVDRGITLIHSFVHAANAENIFTENIYVLQTYRGTFSQPLAPGEMAFPLSTEERMSHLLEWTSYTGKTCCSG